MLFAIAAALLPLSACTWVKPSSDGNSVRVAYDGNVADCRAVGTISVSVTATVGFYHRPALKVRDELESLARNQAAGIPADTIKATSEPLNGAQNFAAYVCGSVHMHQRNTPPGKGEAQTFPIKNH